MKVKELIEELTRMEPMENDIVIRDGDAHVFLAEDEHVMYNTYKTRTSIYVPNSGMKVDPATRGSFKENEEWTHTTYKCPHCGCTLHLDWHERRNYCPECGTRLDWSDTHEKDNN